jgi:hypothetical protein
MQTRRILKNDTKSNLKEMECEDVNCLQLAEGNGQGIQL